MLNERKVSGIIKNSFVHRKDNMGERLCDGISTSLNCLRKQNLTQGELRALCECYKMIYNDSVGSTNVIIALIPVFLGVTPILDMAQLPESVFVYIKGVTYLALLIYLGIKMSLIVKDNAVMRNNVIATSILLAEYAVQEEEGN